MPLATMTGMFVRYQIPFLILEIESGLLVRFLQAQRVFGIQMYVSGLSAVLHWVFCYFFVAVWHQGLFGAAIALDLVAVTRFLIYYFYICRNEQFKLTWVSFDRSTFSAWAHFFGQGLPNAIMVIPEVLGLYVLGFEAAYLPSLELAAFSIMNTLLNILYGVANGFTSTATALMGNSLGERRPDIAARIPCVEYQCYYIFLLCIALLIVPFRHQLVWVFTGEEKVQALAVTLVPIVLVTQLTDGYQAILGGVIRGVGKTGTAALTNLFSYLLVLHPTALILAFPVGLGVYGLWIGWFIGTGCCGLLYYFVWRRLDLQAISDLCGYELRDSPELGRRLEDLPSL